MRKQVLLALLGAIALAATSAEPGANGPEPRPPELPVPLTDSLGDPLPPGALARLGSGRLRHAWANQLMFAPDGKTLASGGLGGVCLWDVATGKLRRRFALPGHWACGIAFTSDGISVACCSPDSTVTKSTLWLCNPATGAIRQTNEFLGRVADGCLSADGRRLAAHHEKSICVYETTNAQELFRVPVDVTSGVFSAFAPDGKTLAVGDITRTVRIYQLADGRLVAELKVADQCTTGVVYSPDARFLAASSVTYGKSDPGHATVWDLNDWKPVQVLRSQNGLICHLAFAPDGRHVALSSWIGELQLVDLRSGKEIRRCSPAARGWNARFSPDGKTLAAMSEGMIRMWDVRTGQVLPGSADPILGLIGNLVFSDDGKTLTGTASVPFDTTYVPVTWDSATGREVQRYPKFDEPLRMLTLSPDGRFVAYIAGDFSICVREVTTGKELRLLKGEIQNHWRLVFSPDSRRLISVSNEQTIGQWDVATGRELLQLAVSTKRPGALNISSDGRWLAVDDYERRAIVLRDLSSGKEKKSFAMTPGSFPELLRLDDHFLTVFSRFVSGAREIRRWDLETGFAGPVIHFPQSDDPLFPFPWVFSPDGRMLAVGGIKLRVLEVASGGVRCEIDGHESQISAFAFSPDSRRLAAASLEAPVYVWNLGGRSRGNESSSDSVDRCWTDLADNDAARAFDAILRLAAAPQAGVRLLRSRLKPAAEPDPKKVAKLIQGLDSDSFAERQAAATELENLGDTVTEILRKAREGTPSAEVRRHLDSILERAAANSPGRLRVVRAIEALERMATPEADRFLAELAAGAANALQTREAAAARDRRRNARAAADAQKGSGVFARPAARLRTW